MSGLRRILITGATDKQGGGFINALVASQASPSSFHLMPLTRKANAARGQALAQKPNISVLEGDLDDCNAIFKGQEPFHSVFSVTTPINSENTEERGKGKL